MYSSQDAVIAVSELPPQLFHDEIGVGQLLPVELYVGRLPLAPEDHRVHVLVLYLVHPQPRLELEGDITLRKNKCQIINHKTVIASVTVKLYSLDGSVTLSAKGDMERTWGDTGHWTRYTVSGSHCGRCNGL